MEIFLGIVVSVFFLVLAIHFNIKSANRKMLKSWEKDDRIELDGKSSSILFDEDGYVGLYAWDEDAVYVYASNESICRVKMKYVKYNHSANWREYAKKCEKVMGQDPNMGNKKWEKENAKAGKTTAKGDSFLDGKHLDLLNEVECQVYLKKAIDEENYKMAELIKKQMEKYR